MHSKKSQKGDIWKIIEVLTHATTLAMVVAAGIIELANTQVWFNY
jgi:hypothetical protein